TREPREARASPRTCTSTWSRASAVTRTSCRSSRRRRRCRRSTTRSAPSWRGSGAPVSDPTALLASLHTASAPRLAGDRVIFELSRPDLETDAYTTRLHAVPVSGPATACPRRVSSGQSDRDVAPAGEARALVRAAPRSPAQLWVGL